MKWRWLLLDYLDPKHEQTAQGATGPGRQDPRQARRPDVQPDL